MDDPHEDERQPDALRERAEDLVSEDDAVGSGAPPSADLKPQRLLNELRVHEVELELQNEELQRIRDELEVSNRQYSELYDFAPSGYLTLDFDGAITLANLAAAQILGTERARLVGRSLERFVSTDDQATFNSWFRGVVQGADPTPCVIQLGGVDDERAIVVQLTATCSLERQECRLLLVDITSRVQAESARRTAQLLQQQQIFERFTDPTFLIEVDDGSYRVSSVNGAFIDWTGLDRSEVIGRPASTWMRPESFAAARVRFDEAARSGLAIRYEDVSTGADGEQVAQITVVPIIAEDGSCHQLLCSVHDITIERRERIELEAERRRHLERLAMLEKFHTLTVGRELRMVELKQEVAERERRIQELEQQLTEHNARESHTGRT